MSPHHTSRQRNLRFPVPPGVRRWTAPAAALVVAAVLGIGADEGSADPIHDTRYAHLFPGLDAGQKINAAIQDLPNGVGTVDAGGLSTPQVLSAVTVPRGVTLRLTPITFVVSETLVVRPGGRVVGASWGNPGHTNLIAAPELQGSVIHATSQLPNDCWHYGTIENLRVASRRQATASTDCITVDRMGEASLLRNLNLSTCRESGLAINGSHAGSGRIEGVSVFDSGRSAVHLDDIASGMMINSLSGDRNPLFVEITESRNGGLSLVLLDMKIEQTLRRSDPVISIDGSISPVHLTIIGGTSISSATRDNWIRVTNSGPGAHPFIQIMGTRVSLAYTNLVNDLGHAVPHHDERISHFAYARNGTRLRIALGLSLFEDLVLFQGGRDRTPFNEWRSIDGELLRSVRKSGLAVPVQSASPPESCTDQLVGAQYYSTTDQQLCSCRHDGSDTAWVLQNDPTHNGHCAGSQQSHPPALRTSRNAAAPDADCRSTRRYEPARIDWRFGLPCH